MTIDELCDADEECEGGMEGDKEDNMMSKSNWQFYREYIRAKISYANVSLMSSDAFDIFGRHMPIQ